MKVLLDECIPIDFRHHLPGHEVHTVDWAGFKGLKNGQLLDRAAQAGYQVLISQQKPSQQGISVLVVRGRTNQLEDLLPMVKGILAALGDPRPGDAVIVGA